MSMSGKLFSGVLILSIMSCYSQDPLPTFPDVFQVDVEGSFVGQNGVDEIDATLFYDRTNNRAALTMTKENDQTHQIYNFDANEMLTINGIGCEVEQIPDKILFLPFTTVNGKKVLDTADKAFFFTEKELDKQDFVGDVIPALIYKVTGKKIEMYGKENCDITHTFTKPIVERPTCEGSLLCSSALIMMSVKCSNEQGELDTEHLYRFFRMEPKIVDESVFLPPPGIHCDMTNSKKIPPFPSYFSFGFDITEKSKSTEDTAVFNTHKEIWYDDEYGIVRIDEFHYNGLLLSSKIFDFKDEVAFTSIATVPTCDMGPIQEHLELDTITRLPKAFFGRNESSVQDAIYVGKRNVNGLDYEVWSLKWISSATEETVVEELYFLQILPVNDLKGMNDGGNTFYQLSHVDMYVYSMNEETMDYELSLLKHFSINNFRSNPKEWAAFDVSNCFNHKQKKEFRIKFEAFPIAKGSQDYKKVLELLYNKIVAETGVSIVRIAKLAGVFDGVDLQEIKGSIIDNAISSGWPKENNETGMEETFSKIEQAAREGKLSITFKGDDNTIKTVKVVAVEVPKYDNTNSCYSGVYVAVASLVLLLIGISFGVGGYYVFLKKRKISNLPVRMSELES